MHAVHLYFYHAVYLVDDEIAAERKNLRGCVTWKLATCFAAALNPESVGVFEEILMRSGVNRAGMQSLFLQLFDATDHLSRHYTICQLWPACTCLRKPEDCRATGEHDSRPTHRVEIQTVVDTQHDFYLFHCAIFPVCFILMPPCCQSDKTFATEAVTIHLRQIRLPHCFLNDNTAASCFTLIHFQRESVLYFIDRPFFINKDDI